MCRIPIGGDGVDTDEQNRIGLYKHHVIMEFLIWQNEKELLSFLPLPYLLTDHGLIRIPSVHEEWLRLRFTLIPSHLMVA